MRLSSFAAFSQTLVSQLRCSRFQANFALLKPVEQEWQIDDSYAFFGVFSATLLLSFLCHNMQLASLSLNEYVGRNNLITPLTPKLGE